MNGWLHHIVKDGFTQCSLQNKLTCCLVVLFDGFVVCGCFCCKAAHHCSDFCPHPRKLRWKDFLLNCSNQLNQMKWILKIRLNVLWWRDGSQSLEIQPFTCFHSRSFKMTLINNCCALIIKELCSLTFTQVLFCLWYIYLVMLKYFQADRMSNTGLVTPYFFDIVSFTPESKSMFLYTTVEFSSLAPAQLSSARLCFTQLCSAQLHSAQLHSALSSSWSCAHCYGFTAITVYFLSK